MNGVSEHCDVLVIGGGPAGQKAAVQAAKAGRRVVLVERGDVGGECVYRGTIPSKTLRASAMCLADLRRRTGGLVGSEIGPDTKVRTLMGRLAQVLSGHRKYLGDQLRRNGVEVVRGRCRFESDHGVQITAPDGTLHHYTAELIFVATGSRPRNPPEIPVDHEHILDSDSILSLIYLPESLVVVGAGVIACEFATIFQSLGVQVTIMDRYPSPLGFLDPEIVARFVTTFEEMGGRFLGETKANRIFHDGLGSVIVERDQGPPLKADKLLIAQGRTATVAGMNCEAAGLQLTDRGFIAVDENCQTSASHIYAMGDVIGPPALATVSMEQGRRAARHALGLDLGEGRDILPVGIYTIPEIASVGQTETQVRESGQEPVVGRARFEEIARGQINADEDGMLKLVCDESGRRILGAHAIGGSACELIHLAQLAMIGELEVDAFIDNVFNFPTMAESYRTAALDIVAQRASVLTPA